MDGLKVDVNAVENAFGADIDYAVLHKIYESTQEETRYSPARCIGCERKAMMGQPHPDHFHELRGALEPHHANEHEALREG